MSQMGSQQRKQDDRDLGFNINVRYWEERGDGTLQDRLPNEGQKFTNSIRNQLRTKDAQLRLDLLDRGEG